MKISPMVLAAGMALATASVAQVQIVTRAHDIPDYMELYSCGAENLSAYIIVNGTNVIELPDIQMQAGDTYRFEADVLSTTVLAIASSGAVVDMVPSLDGYRWLCRTSGPEPVPGTYNPDHWTGAHCGGPDARCDFHCDETTPEQRIEFGSMKALYRDATR